MCLFRPVNHYGYIKAIRRTAGLSARPTATLSSLSRPSCRSYHKPSRSKNVTRLLFPQDNVYRGLCLRGQCRLKTRGCFRTTAFSAWNAASAVWEDRRFSPGGGGDRERQSEWERVLFLGNFIQFVTHTCGANYTEYSGVYHCSNKSALNIWAVTYRSKCSASSLETRLSITTLPHCRGLHSENSYENTTDNNNKKNNNLNAIYCCIVAIIVSWTYTSRSINYNYISTI